MFDFEGNLGCVVLALGFSFTLRLKLALTTSKNDPMNSEME